MKFKTHDKLICKKDTNFFYDDCPFSFKYGESYEILLKYKLFLNGKMYTIEGELCKHDIHKKDLKLYFCTKESELRKIKLEKIKNES